ncbi:MAG: aminotransferase class III-fold pyridoxal phosphate-dependent enzyme [Myxococcota bacterium]
MDPDRARQYPFLPSQGGGLPVARTEGSFLVLADGRRILDAAGGAVVASIGHGRVEVAEVAARALAETTYVVPPFATEERVRLVERLRAGWLPGDVTRCGFASGGSEAIDFTIRVARQHFVSKGEPERWKVIGRELSYHGTTLSGLDVGGHTKRRQGLEPWLHELPKAPPPYPLRCARCRSAGACTLACADALEEAIQQAGPESVAAFIFEPVGGSTAGALTPAPGYLARVGEICRRHGILTIADEVMSGFGRTGARFAVDHEGFVPDLLVSGKGLASGYAPIVGVFAREAVVEPIARQGDEVMFYTYGAHPAACAVADKVLEIMEREALVERCARMGEALRERLQAALDEHPHVAEIRGRGLLQAVELVKDRDTLAPFEPEDRLTATVVAAGFANGVFFYPAGAGAAQDAIVMGPPFTVSESELDLLVTALAKSIDGAVARAAARRS